MARLLVIMHNWRTARVGLRQLIVLENGLTSHRDAELVILHPIRRGERHGDVCEGLQSSINFSPN